MNIFERIGKSIEHGVSRIGHGIEHGISSVYHSATGIPTASEKRDQASAVKEQIQAYKDQTALAAQQVEEARQSKDVEKRKIEEKQIRSLRRNYRPPGGLIGGGMQGPRSLTGVGESSDLPSKLGQ